MIKSIFLAIILSVSIISIPSNYIVESEIVETKTHRDIVREIAGTKYELVCAIIEVESGWNHQAISRTGDYGLMQINKRTWEKHFDWEKILEPEYNISVGVWILEKYLRQNNQNLRLALTRYNGSSTYPDKVFKRMEINNE